VLLQEIPEAKPDEVVEEINAPQGVAVEEDAEKIVLIPVTPFAQPMGGVFERVEDVVKMHVDTGAEARENFVEDELNVATELHDVAGINEQ